MSTTVETKITVHCDSLTCKTELTWVEQDVQKDVNALPDDAFRLLVLTPFASPDSKKVFCSPECLKRALKQYVPPLSPREQAAKAEAEKKAALAAVEQPEAVQLSGQPEPA